jgi:hypothetical protein
MGDRTTAEITIGGRLRRCCVPALLSVLADEGVGPDYNGPLRGAAEFEAHLDDLRARAAELGARLQGPTLGGHEINYGNLDAAKTFCLEKGLAYVHHWDAGSDYTAGNEYWFPGDPHPRETDADQGGAVLLDLAALRHGWADKTVADVLAAYAFTERPVPPLELVDEGVCPGCVAEALQPGSALPQDYPSGETEAA